jgi:hypothetical protein
MSDVAGHVVTTLREHSTTQILKNRFNGFYTIEHETQQ